ncbi:peptide MFS transporter [Shewanella sp. SR44-3]|uniref:peptide MFS transporter n=1 Tax=Shewanella sp. SR44-3 TaxID=2760936 RepID=UPI0015FDF111|nr:peptide MFS transporter [Shewanella sp. SR44-3]MBB1268342.1 peptide MFS transporter [Shewanella sp. SR44-3]
MDNSAAVENRVGVINNEKEASQAHPKGLYVCFFTEMWERFSFYGLKALLIFYLTEHFLFSDQEAASIFGNYFALVYALPLVGGVLADRYLGAKRAVVLGAVLLCFGHFGMTFEGSAAYINESGERVASTGLTAFYLSLSFIIVGVGFLKPNISSIVGKLYQVNDPRKDAGFTLFYMGINLGSALAAIICGYVGVTYGWAYGFGLAGFGMLLGLVVFLRGHRHLLGVADAPDEDKLTESVWFSISREKLIYLGSLGLVAVVMLLIGNHQLVAGVLGLAFVAIGLWLVWYCLNEVSSEVKQKLYAAVSLIMMSTVFFLCFLQSGSSMNLFADRITDRLVFGVTIPAPMLQSLNAIFIIMLAPVFAKLWQWLAQHGYCPSTPIKFSLGLLQVGLGFLALVVGLYFAEGGEQVALGWLVLAYLLHTTGELCISPIGLSMITKLSAPKIVGLMMGLWFLGSAIAEFIAALLAGQASMNIAGITSHQSFSLLYQDIMWIALGGALLTFIMSPLLKRWMGDVV